MRLPGFALLASLPALGGCVAFNEPCSGVAENPREDVAYLEAPVFLDPPNARHANNAIGQGVADALLHASESGVPPNDVAVFNGGALHGEGLCVSRAVLPAGELKSGVLHEVLLYEHQVRSLTVTRVELRQLLEASAARLTPAGEPIVTAPGEFLHLSGGTEQINCANPPTARVELLSVGGMDLLSPGPDVRLAVTDEVMEREEGTAEVFAGLDGGVASRGLHAYALTDAQLAERYFKSHFQPPPGQTFPSLAVDGRIDLLSCAVPGPP